METKVPTRKRCLAALLLQVPVTRALTRFRRSELMSQMVGVTGFELFTRRFGCSALTCTVGI